MVSADERRGIAGFQRGIFSFRFRCMKIHPTAIIDKAAEIADDVKIGPCVCIEGPVVIGPGCVIEARAILTGAVRMGRNNILGHGSIIGGAPQDHSYNPKIHSEVVIGDNNCIREFCTIHRGASLNSVTNVGSHNYLMAGVHLAHNTVVGNHVTMANNALLAGHVEIQDHVYIGGAAVFHQYVRVGRFVLVQGGSGISRIFPRTPLRPLTPS